MAFLDVSDAFDLDLLQTFTVLRLAETIDNHGRAALTPTQYTAYGVVTSATKNDLDRAAEVDIATKSIVIVTQFRLQLASSGFKADQVYWGGNIFQVEHIDDYSRYGAGFIQAIASSIDSQERPPQP